MDYTDNFIVIVEKLDQIITILNNLKVSEYLEILIIIMMFILFYMIERKY